MYVYVYVCIYKYIYTHAQLHTYIHTYIYCLLTGCRVRVFSLILDSSVGLSAGIQSTGDLVSETSQLRILHSAEEDNFSPFDSKIACLCQSIAIYNNKHIYVWIYMYIISYNCQIIEAYNCSAYAVIEAMKYTTQHTVRRNHRNSLSAKNSNNTARSPMKFHWHVHYAIHCSRDTWHWRWIGCNVETKATGCTIYVWDPF